MKHSCCCSIVSPPPPPQVPSRQSIIVTKRCFVHCFVVTVPTTQRLPVCLCRGSDVWKAALGSGQSRDKETRRSSSVSSSSPEEPSPAPSCSPRSRGVSQQRERGRRRERAGLFLPFMWPPWIWCENPRRIWHFLSPWSFSSKNKILIFFSFNP